MPDTGQRHEISKQANSKEAEMVHESKDLASKTKQRAAREHHTSTASAKPKGKTAGTAKPDEAEDRTASNRMVDEGDPNRPPL